MRIPLLIVTTDVNLTLFSIVSLELGMLPKAMSQTPVVGGVARTGSGVSGGGVGRPAGTARRSPPALLHPI
jgi:hypothetical protein